MGSEAQEGIPPEESASHSQEEQVLQVLPAPPEETTEEIQVQAAEKQLAAASTSTSSAAPVPAPAPGERKEDSAAIIESLRARLLSERNSSKSAKQQAHQLTKKVKELEKSLEAEIQHRKRCEEKIQELLLKLKEAGVPESSNSTSEGQQKTQEEQDEDDQQDEEDDQNPVSPSKRSKPSWSIPAKRHYSDGSIDVDQSPSESPVSDSSLVPKRVGRSCRTLRRKETWELGVDDRVKSSWSRVGSDVMELSKLRDMTGSESGWVGRVMEMFEGRNFEGSSNGEQPDIDNGDQEQQQQQQQEQQEQQTETSTVSQDSQGNSSSSSSSSSSSVVGAEVSVANSSKSIELSVMNMNAVHDHDDDENGATNSGEFETSSEVNEAGKENAATSIQEVGLLVSETGSQGNRIEEVGDIGTGQSESRLNDQVEQSASSDGASAVRDENAGVLREGNDVESILRALRIAKQQILAAAGSHGSQGEPVLKRSFTNSGILDLQSVYGDRSHGFVVTRPLAQFVHAPHLPQY